MVAEHAAWHSRGGVRIEAWRLLGLRVARPFARDRVHSDALVRGVVFLLVIHYLRLASGAFLFLSSHIELLTSHDARCRRGAAVFRCTCFFSSAGRRTASCAGTARECAHLKGEKGPVSRIPSAGRIPTGHGSQLKRMWDPSRSAVGALAVDTRDWRARPGRASRSVSCISDVRLRAAAG